jgi:hypothetical protein
MTTEITTSYELDDIPADLAETSIRRGVPVIVEGQWDNGCYMLRLTSCIEDVEWPEEMTEEQIEQEPDYRVLSNSDFDGGYNWSWLDKNEDTAKELLHQYAEHQRALYPGLKVVVDEMAIP